MEIKYQAWNKVDQVMQSWESLRTHSLFQLITDPRLRLRQFTGLNDKNGKEIYEGDLIKYQGNTKTKIFDGSIVKDPWWHIDEIVWEAPKFRSTTRKQHNWIFCSLPNTSDINMFAIPDGEIVGNIWQNPELLEQGGLSEN